MKKKFSLFCFLILFSSCSNKEEVVIIEPEEFIPGRIYYDNTGYVEYRAGNLPVILSSPHGGDLKPTSIPDRDCSECVYLNDTWTKAITEEVYDKLIEETGCYPHVIINLLHRKKFDANRDIDEAADGNEIVEKTWSGYQNFINAAKAQVVSDYDKGIFLDIHGHAHDIERIELGYLIKGSQLRLSNEQLDANTILEESSIKNLAANNIQEYPHSNLIRGSESFGSLLADKGFPSIPSLTDPFPMVGDSYFSGGYNTQRHGLNGTIKTIDAIQIELNSNIRFNSTSRSSFAGALTSSINEFLDYHYNDEFLPNYCDLISTAP